MKTQGTKRVVGLLILAFIGVAAMSVQNIEVTGMVTDAADGNPLIGATVTVKGENNYALTDINGRYSIQTQKGKTLQFSFIGYESKEVIASKPKIDVRLNQEMALLQEEVVIGYGITDRKSSKSSHNRVMADIAYAPSPAYSMYDYGQAEEYTARRENRFFRVVDEPLSTFSIDVDVASYSNMRRYINRGELPPAESVRTEELINYFSYAYEKPKGKDPVNISTEIGSCPWNTQHRLVRVGVKAREIADEQLPPSNLIFLIDVSGSMYGPTRLELVKSSLKLLVNNLREEDKVAIVVYAGSAGEVLPSTSGADKQKIRESLDQLTAGGSTAGGAGIQLAYKIAEKNFIKGGNNRIILCTDGDFNVGVSSMDGLEKLIEEKRKTGIFLTVLGYGMGNYKDNRMQLLAEKGNGNYAYIDNLQEANKVLITEFGGTIYTVAKDVKLQIEFNPAKIQAYRLVGYESRLLDKEDFNDDTKDAGEMGAGHTVTAFYEIVPVGIESNLMGSVDKLKYQSLPISEKTVYNNSPELLTVKLRYKEPNGEISKKIEKPLLDTPVNNPSADFRFASAVAMYAQLLRGSDFKGDATYNKVIEWAGTGLENDKQGYRREFIRLVEAVKGMAE